MIKHKFTLMANGKSVLTKEDISYRAFLDSRKELDRFIWSQVWPHIDKHKASVGRKGSINLSLSWECTMNGRAPRRAPDVIAAEKARRAAKAKAQNEQKAKWDKERQLQILNVRQRIKNQVDHAFITGKSGTEPASKYITCEHCSAPAEFLLLNQKPSPGAAVLDEETIVGAICATHNWRNGNDMKIPCAKLEFFYDGIRQIAIKR